MPLIRQVGHVVLYARDPKVLADWYCNLLDMEVVTVVENIPAYFLSFGSRDHDIALWKAPADAKAGEQAFNHIGLELAGDLQDFKAFHQKLIENDVTITFTADHETAYGIYFLDPDGHQLEVFFQRITDNAKETMHRIGAFGRPIDVEAL